MGRTKSRHGKGDGLMAKPKVSVIIATQNDTESIGRWINTVLSQSLKDYEVIIVDVLSTDGTKDYVRNLAEMEEKVTFLADSFGSRGHAKNMGMNYARGEYIIFVEPDDYLENDTLKYLADLLDENPENDMVFCETDAFGDYAQGCTNKEKKEIIINANRMDNRQQEVNSRVIRRWMYDSITMYRASFLVESGIRHYDRPGYGAQDIAIRFLSAVNGRTLAALPVLCSHCMEKKEPQISDEKITFDVCNEFKYLKEKLREDEKLWQRMRLVFWQSYYDWNVKLYERLSEDIRSGLSSRMRADIKEAIYRREYSRDHFDVTVRKEMELLIESADEFDEYQSRKLSEKSKRKADDAAWHKRRADIARKSEIEEMEQLSEENARNLSEDKAKRHLDRKWLIEEMSRDLAPLRMLLGFSMDEMGSILGVSLATYKNLEAGKREMSWDQFMALLFLFHYNERTAPIVDSLGLYPESLKFRMQKGLLIPY